MVDNIPDSSAALNVYSTDEQIVGVWLNGKNVYRRVFIGSMTGMGATWTNIAQVLDVDEVINLSGTISNTLTDGRSLNLNTYEEEAHNACFSFCKEDDNHLQARVNGWNKEIWGFVFKLYFEYTKTTDEENSSVIAYYPIHETNIYSTEETIIGTWLNKPLYRKVYDTFTIREGAKMDDIVLETDKNKNIKNSYGILKLTDGPDTYVAGIGSGDGGFGIITYVQKNTSGLLYINREHGAYCNVIGIEVVVEYTKTTD